MTSEFGYNYGFRTPQDLSLAVGPTRAPSAFTLTALKQGVEELGQQIFSPRGAHLKGLG